jgi:hypothetical protein
MPRDGYASLACCVTSRLSSASDYVPRSEGSVTASVLQGEPYPCARNGRLPMCKRLAPVRRERQLAI